ncbi:MAG: BMP family ABC transporter substrate-binding protein [Acidimicrobiales bacterium]|nr:MAG: BMP family ABC transporter substrate-binding protein [Acidimicrobiales bacterium]
MVKPTKWLPVVLLIALAATSACGSPIPEAKYSGVNAGAVLAPGGDSDNGFNDMTIAALGRAHHRIGVGIKRVTLSQRGDERAQRLNQLADQRYSPVIAVGDKYAADLSDVASQHSRTMFAIVDCPAPRAENVVNITFAEEQGSYLMGVAAARKSGSGHLGFIGGSSDAHTRRYQAGFVAGARSVKPNIAIDVQYLAGQPGVSSSDGRNSPTAARGIAAQMLERGADVLYHAAGSSGLGVFDAVVTARAQGNRGVWAIGSDTDQQLVTTPEQQKIILTSMVKRVDNAVFAFLADYSAGKATGGVRLMTLAGHSMDFAASGGYLVKYKLIAELNRVKQAIVDGKITVPTAP